MITGVIGYFKGVANTPFTITDNKTGRAIQFNKGQEYVFWDCWIVDKTGISLYTYHRDTPEDGEIKTHIRAEFLRKVLDDLKYFSSNNQNTTTYVTNNRGCGCIVILFLLFVPVMGAFASIVCKL